MTAPTWVFIAGSRWTEVHGTDARLASAIARHAPVIWVEPPVSAAQRLWTRSSIRTRSHEIAPNITALEITGPPFPTRPVIRSIADRHFGAAIRAFARQKGTTVEATIVASPRTDFPPLPGARVYLVSDDWLAGAELMGLDPKWIRRKLVDNMRVSDLTLAVSPVLRDRLVSLRRNANVEVFPNGCEFDQFDFWAPRPADAPVENYAVLCGQLNERLDLPSLEAVAHMGTPLVVVGPITSRDAGVRAAFEQLAAQPNVRFTGETSREQLVPYLAHASVGLTPYVIDDFNRASFPLKTLDYLVAGLPVVSTDLPASRRLDAPEVSVAATAAEFATRTDLAVQQSPPPVETRRARQAAVLQSHSWAARADQLLRLTRSRPNPGTRTEADSAEVSGERSGGHT